MHVRSWPWPSALAASPPPLWLPNLDFKRSFIHTSTAASAAAPALLTTGKGPDGGELRLRWQAPEAEAATQPPLQASTWRPSFFHTAD